MHGLAQARPAADQRHEAEPPDQPRQWRDIGVAPFGVDQRRPQDGPADTVLFAKFGDLPFRGG